MGGASSNLGCHGRCATARTLTILSLAVIVAAFGSPAFAQFNAGAFAGGFSQGLQRGAEIRARRAEAQARYAEAHRQELCNAALENYLGGKGPMPPPMCNPAGTVQMSAEAAPRPEPMPAPAPPPSPTSFTNCTPDSLGGTHCSTLTPGQPTTFTNCSTDSIGGRHCTTN